MRFCAAILLLFCLSCEKPDSTLDGEYLGFFASTFWTVSLTHDGDFEITCTGHAGFPSTNGKYIIQGDTLSLDLDENSSYAKYSDHRTFLITDNGCLIDVESRYDYCKSRPETWRSKKRNISYPQIAYGTSDKKQLVSEMIQKAIDKIELKEIVYSTIYMAEYFEVTQANGFRFTKHGKEVQLLSKDEIEKNQISYYLNIEDFDLGQKSGFLDFSLGPYHKTLNKVFVEYYRKGNKWIYKDYL